MESKNIITVFSQVKKKIPPFLFLAFLQQNIWMPATDPLEMLLFRS